jgi:hypothetical protein
MSLDHLLQWIASIDNRPDLARFGQLLEQRQVLSK